MLSRQIVSIAIGFTYLLFSVLSCSGNPPDSTDAKNQATEDSALSKSYIKDGSADIMIVKARLLKPVLAEMTASLEVLHQEYPQQIAFWQKTLSAMSTEHR